MLDNLKTIATGLRRTPTASNVSARVQAFRSEVQDKISVCVHRGPLDGINRIYEKQCEDFLVEEYAALANENSNLEAALRGTHGIEFEDGYCVNVARLKDFVTEIADDDCFYRDNCPTFGTRHGKCLRCKAREALGLQ